MKKLLENSIVKLQKEPIIFAAGIRTSGSTLRDQMEYAFNGESVCCKSGSGLGHVILRPNCLPPFKSLMRDLVYGKRKILHQHFAPTDYNRAVIKRNFNVPKQIKVIVSLRNIFDVMVSSAERVQQDSGGGLPFLHVKQDNKYQPIETLDIFNNLMLQTGVYFINFYISWYLANLTELYDVIFVDFDDIVDNPVKNIENISSRLGLNINKRSLRGISSIKANINKGKKNRGVKVNSEIRNTIINFSKAYQGIDFSKIGL